MFLFMSLSRAANAVDCGGIFLPLCREGPASIRSVSKAGELPPGKGGFCLKPWQDPWRHPPVLVDPGTEQCKLENADWI